MQRIAIFASGNGSNAENIAHAFRNSEVAEVKLVVYNKPDAGVAERARRLGIEAEYVSRADFAADGGVSRLLTERGITVVVLAGFLQLVPQYLLELLPGRILNIHPSLLPKFGGKGMYGVHVHEAVIAAGEKESGITIHVIDGEYDRGRTLLQDRCPVLPDDTPHTLAERIHELEYARFPQTIRDFCIDLNNEE